MQPIDFDRYREQGPNLRTHLLGTYGLKPAASPWGVKVAGAAFVIAAAAFWGIMLVAPPTTEADEATGGIDPTSYMMKAPHDLSVGTYDPI